ncbi:hypothetical protein [Spirilliplanes yamanashiensis]|uniref:Uncharacterized protein n=1 Tax=Spirilliplanes yamanashiensis TaxID=42233 RepID=A0A8J4DK60_9ACTN|nr:hypothetical protein [Spirilliplanes yamanashiensis]MDP9815466.1 hypothetical protein [Spirilliplanes yamanashiensis]GIJ03720.1 hypothetical protein Sya03_30720 [Spirilliplanes yamanashiensis]
MSDDRLDDGLNAYADNVRRTVHPAGGADVRRRSRQRKQRRAYAAAFGVVLLGSLGLGVAVSRQAPDRPADPLPSASASAPALPLPTGSAAPPPSTPPTATTPTAATPSRTSSTPSRPADPPPADLTSDVSQLRQLGIDIGPGVLVDVADDGVDRWMQIGEDGVDFTGTTKTDTTMMSFKPAPVSARTQATRNRVIIQPPFWNEDAEGPGYCVADTPGAALSLELCDAGRPAQVWTVVPAGDSGQFELRGRHGILRVDDGVLTTGTSGRTGLQTIPFAE